MKVFAALAGIAFLSVICRANLVMESMETTTDTYLSTLHLIRKYGYPAEAHTVETVDGYLLTMHRIPHGKQRSGGEASTDEGGKPPVFLQHGFLGSSWSFFLMAPTTSLAFLLADLGYDVWLGNVRGNPYSRAHSTLFPSDKQFWNFTWHESAIYDLPAQIDFVCDHTKRRQLVYVGFSMGTTMLFSMMSALPQYNEKIQLSLLLAPMVYMKNIKSSLLRFLMLSTNKFRAFFEHGGGGEFLPSSKLIKLAGKVHCESTHKEKKFCMNPLFLMTGSDPAEFDSSRLAVVLNHYPTGYSLKALSHYSQMVRSGKFREYSYGKKRNMLRYGSPTPPEYNLTSIKTPLYLYQGKNDHLSTLSDVDTLVEQLPTLKKRFIVDDPHFTHLHFLFSTDVKHSLYDVLIDDMTSFLNNQAGVDSNDVDGALQVA